MKTQVVIFSVPDYGIIKVIHYQPELMMIEQEYLEWYNRYKQWPWLANKAEIIDIEDANIYLI